MVADTVLKLERRLWNLEFIRRAEQTEVDTRRRETVVSEHKQELVDAARIFDGSARIRKRAEPAVRQRRRLSIYGEDDLLSGIGNPQDAVQVLEELLVLVRQVQQEQPNCHFLGQPLPDHIADRPSQHEEALISAIASVVVKEGVTTKEAFSRLEGDAMPPH